MPLPAIVEEMLKNFSPRSCALLVDRHNLAVLLLGLQVFFHALHALDQIFFADNRVAPVDRACLGGLRAPYPLVPIILSAEVSDRRSPHVVR